MLWCVILSYDRVCLEKEVKWAACLRESVNKRKVRLRKSVRLTECVKISNWQGGNTALRRGSFCGELIILWSLVFYGALNINIFSCCPFPEESSTTYWEILLFLDIPTRENDMSSLDPNCTVSLLGLKCKRCARLSHPRFSNMSPGFCDSDVILSTR